MASGLGSISTTSHEVDLDASEEKAKGLAELMTFFNIGDTGGGGAAVARPAAAPVAATAPPAAALGRSQPPKPGSGEDWEDF